MSAPFGTAPLGYQGLKEKNPPNIYSFERVPTTLDFKNFEIGDIWIYTGATPPDVYMLVDKALNIGSWEILSVGGSLVTQFDTDAGTAIGVVGVLRILGGTALSTTATGNDITINADATVATSYNTDSGVATPATNTLQVIGGTGITTSGSGDTVTVTATSTPSFTWTVDSTTPINVSADQGRIATTLPITYNLPASANLGDEFSFIAKNSNFTLQAQAGQTITLGTTVTSVGGQLTSINNGSTVTLVCVQANTEFLVLNSVGNFNLT